VVKGAPPAPVPAPMACSELPTLELNLAREEKCCARSVSST
jgi:hypothetical protein